MKNRMICKDRNRNCEAGEFMEVIKAGIADANIIGYIIPQHGNRLMQICLLRNT